MKKLLFLSLTILLAFSCKEEEVQTWDDLTEAQKNEIRLRAQKRCEADYLATFNRFKATSSSDVFNSTNYDREKGFHLDYKENDSVKRSVDIRVWKRDSSAREVYFYITETLLGSDSYFLRITGTENDDMIDDLFSVHCDRKNFPAFSSTTGDNGPQKVIQEYSVSNSPNIDEYTDTYELSFSRLAYFANYRLSRTVKQVKADDTDSVVKTINYKSEFKNKSFDFEADIYDAKRTATEYYFTQKFCTIEASVTPAGYFPSKDPNKFGYTLTCQTTKPADWDLAL